MENELQSTVCPKCEIPVSESLEYCPGCGTL